MTMEASNSTITLYVQQRALQLYWNELTTEFLLPNTITVIVYLLIGIVGNLTVILVYQIQMRKKQLDGRYFVAPLAWLDLIAVMVTGTLNLTRNTRSVIFPKFGACKMLLYFSYIATCSSLYLLAAIALQRYLKICRPFGKQMNLWWRRSSVCLCVVIAVITYLPVPFFYGIVTVNNPSLGNATGDTCSVLPGSQEKLKKLRIFQGFGFAVTILTVILITVLYCFVIISIVIQQRTQKKQKLRPEDLNAVKSDSSSTHMNAIANSTGQSITNSELDTSVTNTTKSLRMEKKQFPNKQKIHLAFRISFMFMTISLVGFLAYLPTWVFIVIETNNPTFWKTLPATTFHVCLTLRRMYMINHIANPFIYGIFDQAFRREIMKFFRQN